jgi:hypothetical protein
MTSIITGEAGGGSSMMSMRNSVDHTYTHMIPPTIQEEELDDLFEDTFIGMCMCIYIYIILL